MEGLDIHCKGDIDRLDPIGNLARFALSTQGSYTAAIAWIEKDIKRQEEGVPSRAKQNAVTDLKQAIDWLMRERRRTGEQ